jgi:hypothetical protein
MTQSQTATEIAERAGFDLSLIRVGLSQHQHALDLMLEMERAGRVLRDAAQQAPPTTLRG